MFETEVEYRLAKWILAGMKQDGVISDSEMQKAWKEIAEHYEPPFLEVDVVGGDIGDADPLPAKGGGRMTAKEYLNQARHLDALINCRLREINYWRDLSSSVSGSNFEQHYNPNKPTEAPFVRCLEKIDAIQRDVAEKVAYLVCLKETINAAIDSLASREEQLVLRYRYLDNCSWEEISRMLNVSLRTVHRIHGSALQHFTASD